MDSEKKTKLKKSITSVATSAGILASSFFTSPANIPENYQDRIAPPPSIEYVIADDDDDCGDEDISLPEEEKKKRKSFSSWYSEKTLAIRLILSVLAVVLTGGLLFAIYSYLPVMFAFKQIIGSIFILLFAVFAYAAIAKAVFPNIPIKKLLNKKTLIIIFLVFGIGSYGLQYLISLIH